MTRGAEVGTGPGRGDETSKPPKRLFSTLLRARARTSRGRRRGASTRLQLAWRGQPFDYLRVTLGLSAVPSCVGSSPEEQESTRWNGAKVRTRKESVERHRSTTGGGFIDIRGARLTPLRPAEASIVRIVGHSPPSPSQYPSFAQTETIAKPERRTWSSFIRVLSRIAALAAVRHRAD